MSRTYKDKKSVKQQHRHFEPEWTAEYSRQKLPRHERSHPWWERCPICGELTNENATYLGCPSCGWDSIEELLSIHESQSA